MGGSGFLLSLCVQGYMQAAVSAYVLIEASRNIQLRMKTDAWANHQLLLLSTPFVIAPVPDPLPLVPQVNAKDVHVVAAAAEIRASYLLTLDKGLISQANLAGLSFSTLTPGDFIKTVLATHGEYPKFPNTARRK